MRYFILAALVVFGDQCLKSWVSANIAVGGERTLIPGVVRLTHVNNYGAAFSMLEGRRTLFLLLTVAVCSVIAWLLLTGAIRGRLGRISAGMLLGGAIGNALDRAAAGYVVDMFEFIFIKFAVFNVADIFITFGGLLFCLYALLNEYGQKRARARTEPAGIGTERGQGVAAGGHGADEDVGDDATK